MNGSGEFGHGELGPTGGRTGQKGESSGANTGEAADLRKISRMVEKKALDMLLEKGVSKTEIARQLGISRTALYKKL
ncbi:MAG: helix-turn-helix domain-containing protein [Clostridiales bacterium]|nr:helix-turn-helix domain-containing protein [Clostridiales bacterium]